MEETLFAKTVAEITRLRTRLGAFMRNYEDCIKTRPSREKMAHYVAGQVGPLKRKNVENIAHEAGVPPRTLQNFLGENLWEEDCVACKNREIIRRDHAEENAIGIIDETSDAKKGEKTVGVKRQHCGATGKTDNCVVSVHLAYATSDFAALAETFQLMSRPEYAPQVQRLLGKSLAAKENDKKLTPAALDTLSIIAYK